MRTTTLILAACLLLAGPLHAQPGDESSRTAVRALAAEGDVLMNKGDYAGALDRFSRASSMIPAPTLKLREAVCLEKLGRWVEAADMFRLVSRTQLDPAASPEFREAIKQAGNAAAALEPKLPKLSIVLKGADLAGAKVEVDGKEVPPAMLGTGWPVNPGVRTVVATKGARRAEARAEARESSSVTVELTLPSELAAAAPLAAPDNARSAPPAPATTPGTPSGAARMEAIPPSSQRTWGWVGLGIGAAGLVAGGITGGLALSRKSSLPSTCDGMRCPSSAQDEVDAYNSMRTYSTVAFGVGVVGIGAGLAMLLTAPPAVETKPQAAVHPFVGLGTAGVSGRF